MRLLLAVSPGGIPRIGEDGSAVTLDWRSVVHRWDLGVDGNSLRTISSDQHLGKNLVSTLKESGINSSASFRSGKMRSLLVVSQMALSLILIVGAALLIRTF